MREKGLNIILRGLGLLLLTAAVLKGQELLTTPVANADIWSNRYFLIFQVEFELALGIWLVSGLFKRAAWLAAVICFSLFCCVTLYKGLSGAASCGCFGNVHISPWITLFAIDLPAVLALLLFRPKMATQKILNLMHWFQPWPSFVQFCILFLVGLSAIVVSSPVLLLNEPKLATSQYEVLEPETWIGKELPIIDHIDIGEQLKTGNWLIMLYHHDCPDCKVMTGRYEQMASIFNQNDIYPHIALVELPPYQADMEASILFKDSLVGKLSDSKKWFCSTPVLVFSANLKVLKVATSFELKSFDIFSAVEYF